MKEEEKRSSFGIRFVGCVGCVGCVGYVGGGVGKKGRKMRGVGGRRSKGGVLGKERKKNEGGW